MRKLFLMSRPLRQCLLPALCLLFSGWIGAAEITVSNVQEIRNVDLTSEGDLDWMHFGLTNASSISRKSGVTPRLDYSVLSSLPARFDSVTSIRSTLSWTDGSPTAAEAGFAGGVFFSNQDSGYTLSAPADESTRTLTLHTGGWNSAGSIQIALSDASAPPVTVNLSGASVYHHTIAITYSSTGTGQTLTLTHSLTGTSGNVALQGATLSGAASNAPPSLVNPGNQTVIAGNLLTFGVSATDTDGPGPLVLSISASSPSLPGGVFTDNGAGVGTFSWTPSAADIGTYNVTFQAAENGGAGQQATENITITVNPVASGQLSATAPETAPFNNNLTTEGSLDWMHFGRTTASTINRKSGITPLLTYTQLSASPSKFDHNVTVRPTHAWSDGAPQAVEAGDAGGIFFSSLNSGYTFTAPADTQTRTLKLHLGGWNSTGEVAISLSDSSAAPVTLNLGGASVYHHLVTITYSAASAAQTLTVIHRQTSAGGNVALQSATLAGNEVNQAPNLVSPGNKSVTAASELSFSVSATDPDGPAPLVLDISSSSPALPGNATFTDNGNGSGSFVWTPTSLQTGIFNVTFRARENNGSGLSDSETITITVNAAGSGQLDATAFATSPYTNDLTQEGSLDWMHFGLTSASSINRKAGGATPLTYTVLSGTANRFGDGPAFRPTHVWSDGTPTGSSTGFSGGLYFPGNSASYRITAPADTTERTLKVHLGGWNTSATLNISLSDSSAAAFSTTISGASVFHNEANVTYRAGSAGQTLTLTFTATTGTGNIVLQSASLAGTSGNQPPILANPGDQSVTSPNLLTFAINATDTDGPAPLILDISNSSPPLPVNASLTDNGGGSGVFSWTPTGGQTGTYSVTFRARENNGTGQSDTETISISVNGNQPPLLAAIGNKSIDVASPLSFNVSATDTDGPSPLVLDISNASPALPAGAIFTDNGSGSGSFAWTPSAADVGVYAVTFRAREDNGSGQSDTETIDISVNATGAGQLSVTAASTAPYTNNLTTEGSLDWMHFGLSNASSVNRKSGVSQQLAYTLLIGTANQFGDGPAFRPTHLWSDGTPTANSAGFSGGIYIPGNGASYRITAPADTTERTLKVHLGGWNSTASLNVSLSDGSAAPSSTTISGASVYHNEAIVSYRAASAGQTVTLTLTATTGAGNIVLQSASLGGTPPPLLPFSDDFADNVLDGWTVVDESVNLGNWSIVGGELRQQNLVEDASARVGTYQLGSYLFLNAGSALTDYRFTVDASHLDANDVLSEDIGVMFRYQNASNYYRLTMNSRHGYTRLEKRVGGVFETLAVNSRGYRLPDNLKFTIELRGDLIMVWSNSNGAGDEGLFAVSDNSLTNGTVALYAKHQSRFDNVTLTEPTTAPAVILESPLAHSVSAGDSIFASARALNVPAGGSVEFLLNNGSAVVDAVAPYTTTFASVAPGSHTITASLRNSSSVQVAVDTNTQVGVTGDEIVAIGDSITNGIGDAYSQDNVSILERVIAHQGFEANLTTNLDATRIFETPTIVFNEGVGGDEAVDAAFTRIDSVLERYPDMDRVLLQFGTNDVFAPTPSGLGCTAGACTNTFKGYMQTLIDKIRYLDYPTNLVASNINIHVASTPPNFIGADPWSSTSNTLLRDYNTVIATELNGIVSGPDLFGYFMPSSDSTTHRDFLFADTLHPNALGYAVIAALWHNALETASPVSLPFVAGNLSSSLSSNAPQLDLVATGDKYRLDSNFTINSQPNDLDGARTIKTNNDSTNTTLDYLSFTVDRAVTVYIAYDAGSTARPAWMSAYTATALADITTSDPNGAAMRIYSQSFTAGSTVTLGGNNATGAAGADTNYIVFVREN